MKYSLNWLQEHLATPLPDTTLLAREVTLRAFEVEEVEQVGDDHLLEIKVLPDRAHDALSHRGMAREIGGLFGIARKERVYTAVERDATVPVVRVTIEEPLLCMRYVATRVNNVTITPSPKELAQKIEAMGI
jgi:phenylalanyl-tRNA synthetase beta chain